jgi:hypothetical protein
MDADKRKKTITIVLVMNFIPLVIAVLTFVIILFWGVMYFIYGPSLIVLFVTIFLILLPVLGIRTYIMSFIHRKLIGRKDVWLLGCINSIIWLTIFLITSIYQLSINPMSSILSFSCFIYFAILSNLNQRLYDFEKSQELSQFEVNT